MVYCPWRMCPNLRISGTWRTRGDISLPPAIARLNSLSLHRDEPDDVPYILIFSLHRQDTNTKQRQYLFGRGEPAARRLGLVVVWVIAQRVFL